MVRLPCVFFFSQKCSKSGIKPKALKTRLLPSRLKSNHSSPYRYSIAPLRTMESPNKSNASKVFSSISFESFKTKEATISPTPKALIVSEKYLLSLSIFKNSKKEVVKDAGFKRQRI